MLLKDLTRRLDMLHDAQVLQLKMWPLVLFTHARSAELAVSFENKEVDYIVKTKGKAPADLKDRFEYLNEWTKWLLGNDWLVKVKIQGKQVYRGGRTV